MSKRIHTKRQNGSIVALATGLNLTISHVHRLIRSGMPDQLEAAQAWRTKRAPADDTARELRQQRIALVKSQREKIDLENAVRRRELVLAAEVDQDMAAIGATLKAMLQRIENDLPPVLDGMSPAQIKAELRRQHDRMLDTFTGEAQRRINAQRITTPKKQP
jgi:hypothetical protein